MTKHRYIVIKLNKYEKKSEKFMFMYNMAETMEQI